MGDAGGAIFAVGRGGHFATQGRRQKLHAVADAQNRLAAAENEGRQFGRGEVIDTVGPAGKDIAGRVVALNGRGRVIIGKDL